MSSVKFARTAGGAEWGRAREEDWPEMADVTVARSSERHVGNRESIQMLGRYVTVLRKRTRQCKAPNGVLDNVIARGCPARVASRNPFVQLRIKCANAHRLTTRRYCMDINTILSSRATELFTLVRIKCQSRSSLLMEGGGE